MTLTSRDTGKHHLRASLRAARAGLDPADRMDQSRAVARAVVAHLTRPAAVSPPSDPPSDWGSPTARPTIAAYLGRDPEPGTAPLLEDLHRLGFGVVVPVCEPGYRLSWVSWTPGVPLQRSVRAPVDEPTGPRRSFGEMTDVALILVPALGVDRAGHRLGQGGGYYDRFLAAHPLDRPGAVDRLGVVYRSELLPIGTIPAEPYDQPLAGVFTADGLERFGAVDAGV
ncbi:5-formyltetrahydrofolate cyclo-ligase [Arthrobacter ruber]|uniref:5-formyltetrahydrofolate cyclo-ligase n=1 Tax=Arthrobacter ruber TaxID=1258893 RepID=UPI001300126B|nr:5-formyltetrahydrofolate cyclo-ligase [Arthrobacter ruber]